MTVKFLGLPDIGDEKLKYAVIAAKTKDAWVFCRHRARETWEIPGGHREPGESIDDAARRELYEETGALDFNLTPLSVYTVERDGETSMGKLFLAEIEKLGDIPESSEIREIGFFSQLPEQLTYPDIQPLLHDRAVTAEKTKTNGDPPLVFACE